MRIVAGRVAIALAVVVIAAMVWWALRPGEGPPPPSPPLAEGAAAISEAAPPSVAPTPPSVPGAAFPSLPAAGTRRALTDSEQSLLRWGPRGRVARAETGEPVAWTSIRIQTRRRDEPSAIQSRGMMRGPQDLGDRLGSRFDLDGAPVLRGVPSVASSAPEDLEYRIVAQWHDSLKACTEWRPLRDGPGAPDPTLEIREDRKSTLLLTVRNADGRPFRGTVVVDLLEEDGDERSFGSRETDRTGRVEVEPLPSGTFEVRLRPGVREMGNAWCATNPSSEPQSLLLRESGVVPAEFVLPATGEMSIVWKDEAGAAVRGSWVGLETIDGARHLTNHAERVVGLRAGSTEVTLQAKGYRTWKSTVQVVAGQVTKVEARFEKGEDPK
ncbi:MAG TPA: PEGA domain-containing protein [Planctomycetota bacterium]|nr:PEGA domain-containing protein [Planctomycetota bacterium]